MSPLRVIAFDLSLTRCGVAWVTGTTRSVTPDPSRQPIHPGRRLYQLDYKLNKFIESSCAHIAILEDYVTNARHGDTNGHSQRSTEWTNIRLAELGGNVRRRLVENGIPYVEIHQASLKAFASKVIGHRVDSKADTISAAFTLGFEPNNDDEADAALLHAMGEHRYQPRPDWPDLTATVRRLPWPDLNIEEPTNA